MTLAEARAHVAFPVTVPSFSGLGSPTVYLSAVMPGDAVNLVYPAGPGIPAVGSSHAGILITEFVGRVDRPFMQKFVDQGATVEHVTVGGRPGLWISGGPHEVAYVTAGGHLVLDSLRLSAQALLWQRGDVTLRMESMLPRDALLIQSGFPQLARHHEAPARRPRVPRVDYLQAQSNRSLP